MRNRAVPFDPFVFNTSRSPTDLLCSSLSVDYTQKYSQYALAFICSLPLASLLQLMCCRINIFVALWVEYAQGYS